MVFWQLFLREQRLSFVSVPQEIIFLYIFQAISLENRIMDRFVWRELGFVWFYGFAKLFSSEQYGKTGALAKKITRQLGS